MRKILITAAGTGTAFSYITAIGKNFPELSIVTADTNSSEYITGSLFSEKHIQICSVASENYISELSRIISNESIDFYLPLIDFEIHKALSSGFDKIAVTNNYEFCNSCIKKDGYQVWASEIDIKTPALLKKNEIKKAGKFVAKKNGGFGGRETKIIESYDLLIKAEGYAYYEYIDGNEYTVDCFPLANKVISTVRKRVEVKNGVSVKAKIEKNKTLSEMATRISGYFGLVHPFCFQVIKNNDKYYLIDVNPRLGAGSSMSEMAGCDYFSAHIAMILGGDPMRFLMSEQRSCIVTRQYSNYLMKTI